MRKHMQSGQFYPKPHTYRKHRKKRRRRKKLDPLVRDEMAEENVVKENADENIEVIEPLDK
jgi:hypothetical protein